MEFCYSYRDLPLFTIDTYRELACSPEGSVEVSLDLGLSRTPLTLENGKLKLPSGFEVDLQELSKIKEKEIWALTEEGLRRVCTYANNKYYKLVYLGPKIAPTLEISGIHMHRVKDTDPWTDACRKIKLLRVFPGAKVLDIGTGLGYTAIASMLAGGEVLSVEKDEIVLKIAEFNPWSRKLQDPKIKILVGDATALVKELEGPFDRIVHDPPRFALAGELYSEDFYRDLYRLLNEKGRLFHYVGHPGRKRRKDILSGVSKRLKLAGFRKRVLGDGWIIAEKTA